MTKLAETGVASGVAVVMPTAAMAASICASATRRLISTSATWL
jgi:hypothetical protein